MDALPGDERDIVRVGQQTPKRGATGGGRGGRQSCFANAPCASQCEASRLPARRRRAARMAVSALASNAISSASTAIDNWCCMPTGLVGGTEPSPPFAFGGRPPQGRQHRTTTLGGADRRLGAPARHVQRERDGLPERAQHLRGMVFIVLDGLTRVKECATATCNNSPRRSQGSKGGSRASSGGSKGSSSSRRQQQQQVALTASRSGRRRRRRPGDSQTRRARAQHAAVESAHAKAAPQRPRAWSRGVGCQAGDARSRAAHRRGWRCRRRKPLRQRKAGVVVVVRQAKERRRQAAVGRQGSGARQVRIRRFAETASLCGGGGAAKGA